MNTSWRKATLADIAMVKGGKRLPKGYRLSSEKTEFPYITVSDFNDHGSIDTSSLRYISAAVHAQIRSYVISSRDLYISIAGTIGKTGWVPESLDGANLTENACRLVLKESILKEYLYYFTRTNDFTAQAGHQTRKSAQPKLALERLKQIEIPLPPLAEQQRIVAILDEAFAGIDKAIANTERNLANAKELFESYLNSVFANPGEDWEERTLAQVSREFGRGKSKHRPRNDKKLYGGKYPFIQTGDIRNSDHFITKYTQTYNETGLAQSKLWPKGTICITIAANIAETGILAFDSCFPDSVIGMVPDEGKADTNFVEFLLQFFKTSLQAKGKGSAQDNINMATFENEVFPFPPLIQQKTIVAKLDAIAAETKKLENVYQQKLAGLADLKQSILQKAFTGELTAKGEAALAARAERSRSEVGA